jgi:predicted RNA-binding protein with RPS1 domain
VETQTVKPQPERPKDKKSDDAHVERFEDLARKLLEVSKQELDEKRNGETPA